MNDNNNLKFRIANIIEDDEEYIEYPIFSNYYYYRDGMIFLREEKKEVNQEIDINDILPISSYYYETVALLEDDKEIKELIYKYEEELLKAWLIANDNNYEELSRLIEESSSNIKEYYKNKDLRNQFIEQIRNSINDFEGIFNK